MSRLTLTVILGASLVAALSCMQATHVSDDSTITEQSDTTSQSQTPKDPDSIQSSPDSDCDANQANVRGLIQASKTCAVNKDCVLFSPGCPFGCVDAVHRSQVPLIKSAYSDYARKCGACVYMCPQPAFEQWAVCEESRCVVREKTKGLLKKRTLEDLQETPET